jgi:NAD(P)-dependent dehydrogenase (short-subunit alcohol dehydrogenase family)
MDTDMTQQSRGARLAGKKALITGAAGGLGRAMAHRMAEQGASLALTDINEAGAAELAAEINARFDGSAFAYGHDVTREDDWQRVIAAAVADLGGLSVLVNNAGIGGTLSFVEAQSMQDWHKVQAVNVDSVVLGCKHAMAHLAAAGEASIVNISSIAGLAAAPGMGAYNASKAAVWLYTKTIALECAKAGNGVRCNSVHPVFIKTPILDPFVAMAGGDEAKAHERLTRGIPLKRIGEPDDVAWCVVYLASDESRFITGAEIKIDGGMSAQ